MKKIKMVLLALSWMSVHMAMAAESDSNRLLVRCERVTEETPSVLILDQITNFTCRVTQISQSEVSSKTNAGLCAVRDQTIALYNNPTNHGSAPGRWLDVARQSDGVYRDFAGLECRLYRVF